ncbi:cAMP-binding protein [Candidatus Terasakiella magnetica]|nr:cAMP-binding protein [Candidatus Terasakiella magnetica]
MISETLSALRKNPLFELIPATDLAALLDGQPIAEFDEGDDLFQDGDRAERVFLILSGDVILLPGSDATASASPPFHHLGPGDTVGEESVLTGHPYCATARAGSAATAVAIPGAVLMAYLENHFEAAIAMISAMAAQLRERVREITELKMQSTAERLASYLLALAGDATGHTVVRLPYEKRHLADHLGMDPATLSRAFAKLRDKGVVASRTDKVEIEDVSKLRRYGDCAAFTS